MSLQDDISLNRAHLDQVMADQRNHAEHYAEAWIYLYEKLVNAGDDMPNVIRQLVELNDVVAELIGKLARSSMAVTMQEIADDDFE